MENQFCLNCGQPIDGLYCKNCGQRNDVARLRWASLADNFLATFVGDGAIGDKGHNARFGVTLTIWAIATRPGKTVREFLDGRRRKYFNPVTILILLSGLFALISSLTGYIDDTPKPSKVEILHYFNILYAYCQSHPAMWYLGLLPFMALAGKWVFRKIASFKYVEYLYIGIFAAIFSVLLLFVQMPFDMLVDEDNAYVTLLSMTAQCWFATDIYRNLFGISFMRAFRKWISVTVISYTMCLSTIVLAVNAGLGCYYLFAPESFTKTFSKGVSNVDTETPADPAKEKIETLDDTKQAVDSLKTK